MTARPGTSAKPVRLVGVARLLVAIGLVGLVASGAAAADAGFVYALQQTSDGVSQNQIWGFRLDSPSGSLTPLNGGSPVATTGGIGNGSTTSETLAYLNGRLYAINQGSGTLSAFAVNRTTGALTALPFSPIQLGSGAWFCVAVHPTGSPVVVGDANGRVASFAVTSTTATAAPGSPITTGAGPYSCAFSRDGNYVYTGGNSANVIAGFGVNASTGALTPLTGSPFDSGNAFPVAYVTDASGRLFMTNYGSGELRAFTTASGIPSAVTGNPFASGLSTGGVVQGVLHPSGFYLVADRALNQVGVYKINGSGSATTLSAVAGSPFRTSGTFTDALALAANGALLVAANGDSRNLTVFQVNASTGFLTSLVVQTPLATAGRITGLAIAPPPGGKVLILDTTVSGGASSLEAQEASALGLDVEIATPAAWATKTTADFASYRAIILGDPSCRVEDPSPVAAAVANTAVWSPAISGNIIINGTDPVFHAPTQAGAITLIQRGVDYAAAQVGRTGLYVSLSCYYFNAAPKTPLPLLNGLGTFTAIGVGNWDDAHIVAATHPALAGLSDALLSNWGAAIHEGLDTWPSNFQVLAIARGSGTVFTAPDGSVGTPYILGGQVTVPGPPTNVSAVGGNAQATVTFTAPASKPIASYTVTASPGGAKTSGSGSPLTVTGLTNGTAYTFTVVAINGVGSSAPSTPSNSVTPATVPGPPTGVSAVGGNAQATVSFIPPGSNGGAAITSYRVTANPGGATTSGPSSPLTVTGLTNGTAYTFTVVAINSAGSSVPSSPSNSVTPLAVPGPPTNVIAVGGNAQATVSFTPPVSNGGAAITSYRVTASPGGATTSGPGSPLTVTGLTNGTAYTFTVVAINSVGPSTASSPSNSVTPGVTVPNVVGLPAAAATAAIRAAGLVVGAVTNAPSATVPPESVISQTPPGGTQAKGSAVNLLVSSGLPPVAVFRPSIGGWFIRNSSQALAIATATFFQWGLAGDVPIAADFDGDGTIELSVFRPATGQWFLRYSRQDYDVGTPGVYQWGMSGDVPVASDFDGDGQSELAVYRPSIGGWFIRKSSEGYAIATASFYQWGQPGDVPITADFDGDGKMELAVWRPSNGTWYIRYSSRNYEVSAAGVYQWGQHGDVPLAGDFDGDGRNDLAIFRPSVGGWFILKSSEGYDSATASLYQWGQPGDVAIAADLDADGKTDLTIFRPATGEWFIRYSAQGYDAGTADVYQWGAPGDVPITP